MPEKQGCLVIADGGSELPWMVMVHGASQDHRMFDQQVAAFSPQYRLLLIDLPGHGISGDIAGPYDLPRFADHIAECMQAHDVRDGILWGTHSGASAGLLLSCLRPGIFRALILESPVFPGRVLPAVADLLLRVSAVMRSDGLDAARRIWWDESPWFDRMRADPDNRRTAEHRRIVDAFSGCTWIDSGHVSTPVGNIDAALAALDIDIFLFNGEYDVPDFLDAADALERLIPRCHRIRVEGAGGFPFWEEPDRVNALVTGMLQTLPDRGNRI